MHNKPITYKIMQPTVGTLYKVRLQTLLAFYKEVDITNKRNFYLKPNEIILILKILPVKKDIWTSTYQVQILYKDIVGYMFGNNFDFNNLEPF